jgi:preprotein translocase subunit SecD
VAARRPPSRPGVRLGALAVLLIALYSGMAGSGHLTPPLGLDLEGGTTLTLTPQKVAGHTVSKNVLNTAVDIIRQRVNGLGVSGADVVTQGNNVVISVPGKGRSAVLDQVGQTASLSFREIYTDSSGNQYIANNPTAKATPSTTTSPSPSASVSGGSGATGAPSAGATAASASTSSSAHDRPLSSALTAASPSPTPTPTVSSTAATTSTSTSTSTQASTPPTTAVSPSASATTPPPKVGAAYLAAQGAAEKSCLASLPLDTKTEANQKAPSTCTLDTFATLDCSQNGGRPVDVDDDPHHYISACDSSGTFKYLLTPADIEGTQVSTASATIDTTSTGVSTGQWIVQVTFKNSAVGTVTKVSTKLFQNNMQQLAITLDGVVVSAPATNAVLGANIEISGGSGGGFTQKQADNLANALKYGSLPVAFNRSTAETISASLGHSSLRAGLLAGGIGLILVLIYVFLYYRMLGFVTVASLLTSGLLVYASITLLGVSIGYTLSLAGIAGLIVSIGITADSFVVFFERLKDEMRDGRSPRLAVEYGWVRARRTIFTADTVSFLAAVILYIVSVGDVKGFAFTLGLSTILDIVVVLLFTKPLMSLVIKYPSFSTSPISGISAGRVGRTTKPREA